VTFQTTAGTFAPGNAASVQVSADAGGYASADLVSPRQITTGRVTATVNGVTREAAIRFERALPNVITAAVDMPIATAATSTKIRVTATLLRNVGTVSDGTVVTFEAEKADGTPVGLFTNVTTTTNGTASADFLPNTTEAGTVTITVGAQGTGVTGTVQVVLTGS
jgi:phage tail sheath gpL-like